MFVGNVDTPGSEPLKLRSTVKKYSFDGKTSSNYHPRHRPLGSQASMTKSSFLGVLYSYHLLSHLIPVFPWYSHCVPMFTPIIIPWYSRHILIVGSIILYPRYIPKAYKVSYKYHEIPMFSWLNHVTSSFSHGFSGFFHHFSIIFP